MKPNPLLSCLRAALLCSTTLAAPAAWPLDAGAPAPELKLPGLKEAVDLASLKGKVVYVDFWASWCGPCKQSFPFMNDLQAKYRAEGFEILAINLDAKREDADKFLAEVPAQFTLAFDAKGDSAKRFENVDRKDLETRIAQALTTK
jgi:cytochrome c biogenesis protein CcmG/thiol:disulfide interchange protein DsbE